MLVEALLLDEVCGEVELRFSQVDGQSDSPVSQGKEVEVERSELKEMEGPMKGWSQVRRKRGQVEKEVAAETRGWEEFYEFAKSYPHLAHCWRYERWSREVKRGKVIKDEEELKYLNKNVKWRGEQEKGSAHRLEVMKWLARVGEGQRGGDVL